jgi:hypothetical protein
MKAVRQVVMRLADMDRVHPRQDNSRVCASCGERVGVYPSGQHALLINPRIEIICQRCVDPQEVGSARLAPGAEREPFESVRKAESDEQ